MPVAKESKVYDPAPAGTHVARCYGCISLGTQHSEMFADTFKILLLFELPFELIQVEDKDMPMTISKEYTLSIGKKATLRKHLDSWRGRPFTEEELQGFEVSKVVGAPCQVTVVHNTSATTGNTYAKIESITGLAKGMTCPDQVHASLKYEIEEGRNSAFEVLPEWIRKKIESCEEWKTPTAADPGSAPAETAPAAEDDDVPF